VERRLSSVKQIPNILTATRVMAVVMMLVAATLGATGVCACLAAWALASDALDGPLARKLGVASESGARFDSAADCTLYLSAPWIGAGLSPWLRINELPLVVAIFAAYAVPIFYGMLKFRRLTSYHTTAARVSAILIVLAAFVALAFHVAWPLYLATLALVASAIEEIAITRALDDWRAEIPSLFSLSQPFTRTFRCRNAHTAESAVSASLSPRSR
jgi:CDP-diacylglycerol--glycerol-3-phosphate 3-phosphatidyltransferase